MGTVKKGIKKFKKSNRKRFIKVAKVSPAVKEYVKVSQAKKEETKTSYFSQGPLTINAYDVGTQTLTTYDITQTAFIAQGTGEGNRIGNKIAPTALHVRGFINILATGVIANAYFRVVVLRKKVGVDNSNGTYSALFQLGSSVAAPTGTLLDMMRPFNKDYFRIYASKMCIIGASDSVNSIMPGNNTSMSHMFHFNLSKYIPKLQYNDGTTFPTNFGMYLSIIPCNANGTAITNGQLSAFTCTWESQIYYKDS